MKNSIKTALLFLLAGFLFGACEKEDGGAAETPLPAGAVEVRGTLIDIRTFAAGKEAFPQQSDYIFDSDIETLFDPPLSYAPGLLKARGAEAFRCGSAQTVYMATTSSGLNAAGWSATEKSFTVNDLTYHLYSYVCRTPGQWIEIPDPADREYATMLFAETLSVACDPVPGTVVAQVPELRGSTVSNASIAILPNGNYVASCTGVTDGAALFVSKDRGATWSLLVENVTALNHIRNYYNLFVFEGALYMMGAGAGNQNLLISRSEDNGVTWTEPTDATNGVLLTGGFHSAAVPVVVYDGRLWRACETAGSDTSIKRPFVISAPVDADLLDASSWTKSDNLITDNEMIVNEKTVTELIEGKNLRDDVAANGPYVADDLERLASKLMDAVRAVHAAGIVHRDIKPTNVMVSATGPVLVDFGIAMGEGESHVTRTGLVMGTPGFIAPEIIEGTESDEITHWWSVSSVLAFAATGKPVFGTKPMMAVLEREASGNANLTGLPATTMTAFRAALNPDRSKRCTPEQLLQAITVDAFNPDAWQQYDDDAAQSGQTDVMRPFDHTGLRNPRLLWRPHEPAGSGEKPTAAVTKAGMPRQTAMSGVRPALQRIIGQSAPSPYATVPPIPRLPNVGQAADAAPASLRRLPSIGTGADAGTSDGTVPLRGAPLPGNIASSQAPGNDQTAPMMSRLTPPMPPTMPVGTEATESLRPQPTSVLPASTMPFDSTVSVGRTMPMQPQPTTALPTDDADITGATAVIEPSSSADTAATLAMDDPVWSPTEEQAEEKQG